MLLPVFSLLDIEGDLRVCGSFCPFIGVEFICDPAFTILVRTGVDAFAMLNRG